MKPSRTPPEVLRLFSELPTEVQEDARRAWRLFQDNPAHPGLQFKKLEGEDDLYSARIGLEYARSGSDEETKPRLVLDWQTAPHTGA